MKLLTDLISSLTTVGFFTGIGMAYVFAYTYNNTMLGLMLAAAMFLTLIRTLSAHLNAKKEEESNDKEG